MSKSNFFDTQRRIIHELFSDTELAALMDACNEDSWSSTAIAEQELLNTMRELPAAALHMDEEAKASLVDRLVGLSELQEVVLHRVLHQRWKRHHRRPNGD